MTKQSKACLIGATAVAGAALAVFIAGSTALAQSSGDPYALGQRIDRIEDQLYNLRARLEAQRNSLAAPGSGDPSSVAELSVRLNAIEEQLRNLIGKTERATYEVDQLNARLSRFQEDTQYRLRQLEGGGRGASGAPNASGSPRPGPGLAPDPNAPRQPGAPRPLFRQGRLQGGTGSQPPQDYQMRPLPPSYDGDGSSLTKAAPPRSLGRIPASAVDGNAGAAPEQGGNYGPKPRGEAEAQYERAYEDLLRRRFDAAEAGFKGFLRQYPQHDLAGNAQYWLGETYYARGRYKQAASAFMDGYRKFSSSRKAPDSLLKLAITLKQLGQTDETCAALNQLDRQFPNASRAIKSRAGKERTKLGC